MIQNIDIKKLHSHPYNPRKDLGDLTELANSIRTNGVFQNLTVVLDAADSGVCKTCGRNRRATNCEYFAEVGFPPCPHWIDPGEQYTVVIGHRRLEAAKMAGLTELPCAISDMDMHEQVATMLLENMQRADLTVIEQADGFQMMIDFGETPAYIAEKTGFTEATVRHRLKLKELDRKKFEEATVRGGRIEDYIALEKIKDAKVKNKLLEHIGTTNFKWSMEQALSDQELPERKKALIAQLGQFAKAAKREDINGLSYVNGFYNFKGEFKKPNDVGTVEYFYTVDNSSITLYKKEPKAAPKKKSKEEKAFEARLAMLKDLAKRAYELRWEFIKNFTAEKKYAAEIHRMAYLRILNFNYSRDYSPALELLGIEKPDGDPWKTQEIIKDLLIGKYKDQPEYALLAIVYANCDDNSSNSYFESRSWENSIKYQENKGLNLLYDGLISIGYQMSDEEKALRDGTHELFNLTDTRSSAEKGEN
jgi:ParB family transcriptional regulator, chromosome partitioning protein